MKTTFVYVDPPGADVLVQAGPDIRPWNFATKADAIMMAAFQAQVSQQEV